MKTYLDNEMEQSIRLELFRMKYPYSVGVIVEVTKGDKKGIQGVIQNIDHSNCNPIPKDKVRVWLDGCSCIDIYDFNIDDLKLIPRNQETNMDIF